MSAPISDDENSDYSKFAPKRLREQLANACCQTSLPGANGTFVQ